MGLPGDPTLWHVRGRHAGLHEQGVRYRRRLDVPAATDRGGLRFVAGSNSREAALTIMSSETSVVVGRGRRMTPSMPSAISNTSHHVSLRLLHRITLGELGLFTAALPLVAAVRLALWILPSRTILRLVRRFEAVRVADSARPRISAARVAWAIEAVSRRIPGATCLTQALSAKLLLWCFGQHAQLCLGVARTSAGTFRAHAWLERDGRPVLGGAGIQSFVRLPELPDAARIARSLTH